MQALSCPVLQQGVPGKNGRGYGLLRDEDDHEGEAGLFMALFILN